MPQVETVPAASVSHNPVLPTDAYSDLILGWYAPDFIKYQKTWLWYAIAFLVDAALISFAFASKSYTMAAVFILLPLVYLLEQKRKPKMAEVIISHYGIKFGEKRIPYSEIQKFWIVHHPPYINEIHLLTNGRMKNEIVIHMMNMDPVLVRTYLVTQIREWEGKKEPFLDIVVRLLKLA